MNEITLNALINLFAIFSVKSKSDRENAQNIFLSYLKLHLGISSSEEYLRLFDELLDLYGIDGDAILPVDIDQQAENIANNIKSRLHRQEQIMVFLRFMELSRTGETENAEELFRILASVFSIPEKEVKKYREFIFSESPEMLSFPDFLLINSEDKAGNQKIKHLQLKNLDGELLFLYLQQTGSYIFNFRGKESISLEGNSIVANRFYAFKEGGILRGPRIQPVYYSDITACFFDQEHAKPFVLRGEEIEFKFKNSNNGLHRFSFSERSGQLIAIMGGSGVGKSTLLNILNGNIPVDTGHILINQLDIHKNKKETQGLIGFVPQDDLLFEDLTVWENLYYNACLCFDGHSEKQINQKVARVLHELELHEFKDLKVGNPLKKTISGGQRKRLNVALELIREPAILYVDEPTSGLSSMDSEKVMLLLKEQARKGKIIMVNIHQPSSAIFKLFDKLWIMDKGGRPIYTGNPLDAIIYFKTAIDHVNSDECECLQCGNVNPEQVLEIVETRKIDESGNLMAERQLSPDDWYQRYKKQVEPDNTTEKCNGTENPKSEFRKPGRLKQFTIFMRRNLRIKVTDKQYLLINLVEAPLLALIVAYFTRFAEDNQYIFFENKNLISYLFMAIVVVLFMGMSVSAEEIIKDRKILQRESFLNLSRLSYLYSKILFLILLSAFQTFCFVLVGNLVLEIHGMNFPYWLVLFSTAVFANMLGLNISSAFDSVVTIYILIPLLLIPQILLCGVIVKFDDLQDKTADKDVVPLVGEFMVSRWAFEALAVEQFANNRYMARFFDQEKEMARAKYVSDLLATELTGRIDHVSGLQKLKKPDSETAPKLRLIKNELQKLGETGDLPAFSAINELSLPGFSPEIADSSKRYLEKLKSHYQQKYNAIRNEKDRTIREINQSEGSGFLYNQKMKYHNKSLEDLVMNAGSKEYYRETANGIMQKVAPVYKKPDFSNGRAHFLSSEKIVGGLKVNTLFFNLFVIWLMNLVLFFSLYFDWIRKSLTGIGRIKN
ncbi:MAG: ATP-binding cassette domain-containing protein [Prolixibacteraceae bacterium]|jgi:ABC-type multidrug transport system ATPase subunit|nr:ATP-binding cassette domain-containing protein [Prolixibacteraceae bacterium]